MSSATSCRRTRRRPPGAQVLDLNGKFILPGLIDSHVHWEEWMGELYVNHGVTSVVALSNVAKALRTRSQAMRPIFRALFHSGDRPLFTETSSDAEVRQAVRDWLRIEPDMANFPTHNERIARAYAIAADETHKAGIMIFGHAENAPQAVRDGLDVVEHVWGYTQAGDVACGPARLPGRQASHLGDVRLRLGPPGADDPRHDRARRLSQSHAALRMGRHERARERARARGLCALEQSRARLFPQEHHGKPALQAPADQKFLLALRDHGLDQSSADGGSQGVRGGLQERARIHARGLSRPAARSRPARMRSPAASRARACTTRWRCWSKRA